jgi:hypothetical protein
MLATAILGTVMTVACSSRELEVTATQPVDVLLLPKRADVEGNKKVGILQPGSTVVVKNEVLQKDMAAYEVEFVDTSSGNRVSGYVLLGSPGLQVRPRT